MANNKLVTVDVLQYNNDKIKEQLNKKISIQQDVADADKLLGIDTTGKVIPVDAPDSVKISDEAGNQIEEKTDGIYVKDMSVKVSTEDGNAITSKDDGLYVPSVSETKISAEEGNAIVEKSDGIYVPSVSETKVSQAEGNTIETKDDGIYVATTDLSGLVEKVDGKGLSTNDLTDEMVEKIGNTYTKEETYSRTEVDDAITNAQLGGEEVDLSEYIKEADADEKYVLDEEIKVYTEDDITALLGLSEEELEGIAQLISDAEVRIDKTYSSSKIYSELNRILEEGKTYTLTEIAKKSGASYKIAATTDDMISTEYIYLIANGDTYDMYICEEENSVPVKIGTTEIDLSGFYSKTESENLFATKVDVIANYATKSELQSAIADVEVEISTDEDNQIENRENGLYVGKQYIEIKQVDYEALGDKVNSDNVVYYIEDGASDEVKLVTKIDSTVSDTEIPTAKAVYDSINDVNDNLNNSIRKIGSIQRGEIDGTVLIESGTAINICEVTLSPGIYLMTGRLRYSPNGNGFRGIAIHSTSQWKGMHHNQKAIGNNIKDCLSQVLYYRTATEVTLYLIAQQDSGETLTVDVGVLDAIRLAEL